MTGGAGTIPADGEEGVDASDRLVDELRAVALLALDRLDPLLTRLGEAVADGAREGADHGPGAPCPLCRALAAVRSGSEPARRLAEHATGLAAAVRDALADPAAPSSAPSFAPADPPVPDGPARDVRVEHIPVERVPVERAAGGVPC